MNAIKHTHFNCSCLDPAHTIRFEQINWDSESPPEISVSIQLNQYLPFWTRVKIGLCYIFDISTTTDKSHWDTVELDPDEVERLYVLAHQARVTQKNYEIKANVSDKK